MFFLVFVLFTSRWSVRKVLDCFSNMHLSAKLQPYRYVFLYQSYGYRMSNYSLPSGRVGVGA